MTRALILVLIGVAMAAAWPVRQQQTFRASVDVVTLDVSVLKDNRNVRTLTAGDFVVTDNGVRQTVDVASASSLPLDVTLVLDQSGSMESATDSVMRQLRSAAARLNPVDRLRLVMFAATATEAFELRPGGSQIVIDPLTPMGKTSLFDAIASALIRVRPSDRNELAIVLSDGIETSSVLSMSRLQQVARRSDIPLHVFITYLAEDVRTIIMMRPDYGPLEELANLTGGRLQGVLADGSIEGALTRVLDDYRSSYTLRYTATGVPRAGWHDLKVSVNQPGTFHVRARKGYFGE